MEELATLLKQRRRLALSAHDTFAEAAAIDGRIGQVVEQFREDQANALPRIKECLSSSTVDSIQAAAFALLKMRTPEATDLVVQTFLGELAPTQRNAWTLALSEANGHDVPFELIVDAAPTDNAAVLAIALAADENRNENPGHVEQWMDANDADTRIRAWQYVALMGSEDAV